MALFDWNHNGKKDFMDDYIEYNIYKRNLERIEAQKNEYGSYSKRTTKFNNDTEKENSYSSSNKSTSMPDKVLITIGAVAAGILFIGVVVNFNISSSSQDRSYGSYNSRYNSNYNSNNNMLSRETEENTEMETSGYEKNTYKYSNYSNKTHNKSNKVYDKYNVRDYSNAEDFYEDNYDDFDGEEDAEDYYDDVMAEYGE